MSQTVIGYFYKLFTDKHSLRGVEVLGIQTHGATECKLSYYPEHNMWKPSRVPGALLECHTQAALAALAAAIAKKTLYC